MPLLESTPYSTKKAWLPPYSNSLYGLFFWNQESAFSCTWDQCFASQYAGASTDVSSDRLSERDATGEHLEISMTGVTVSESCIGTDSQGVGGCKWFPMFRYIRCLSFLWSLDNSSAIRHLAIFDFCFSVWIAWNQYHAIWHCHC